MSTTTKTSMSYRTIELGAGEEVFYREAGDPSGVPLLMLHGFPSTSAQYERVMQRLSGRVHTIAPDLPGFGRSFDPTGEVTFDALADVIERFTEALGLERYGLYMFDFGAPVGFRLAVRHPERVAALVIQNGNAYLEGLGPRTEPLGRYWQDRAAVEPEVRGALSLEATRTQYVEGVPEGLRVNPDLWELDQRYLEMPGRDRVMLDLLYDYQHNLEAYPAWQEYLRSHRPATLIAWGIGDRHFPPVGAHAYLNDLPEAELHLLETGHFATATHSDEIAELIADFSSGSTISRSPLR
jgi:pimeloyl-ACP methyl ester carboxylesterase